jgi:hypothetical protein
VVGAADGEPGKRRMSGEQWRSGQGKIEGKNDVQQPGRVLGKLKEELRVQKRRCPCASRSWHRRRAWRSRRRSGRRFATWRLLEQASTGSGGRRHGRRVTRGMSEGRWWHGRCCDGERRRSAARAEGGRRGRAERGQRGGR